MSTSKQSTLTDLQLLILSKASQRDDHAIELPSNLKGGAAAKLVKKLIDGGLVEEVGRRPECRFGAAMTRAAPLR
jgi:hypothetical protein